MPRNKSSWLAGPGSVGSTNRTNHKSNSGGTAGHRRNGSSTGRTAASGSSGSGGGGKKIVIRPYSQPPILPPNYYETTVKELLQGTLSVLDAHPNNKQRNNSNSNDTTMSLQSLYQAVVHLVSHQYGSRLYPDLRASMKVAAAKVLPTDLLLLQPGNNNSSSSTSTTSSHSSLSLLKTIPAQYQQYTDYLLLCKHIFLPLDRTHVWQPETETVSSAGTAATAAATSTTTATTSTAAASAAASSSSNNNNNRTAASTSTSNTAATGIPMTVTTSTTNTNAAALSTATHHHHHAQQQQQQTLWQVGLTQFAERLAQFGWDVLLYQEWMECLWQDWNHHHQQQQHANSFYSTSSSSYHSNQQQHSSYTPTTTRTTTSSDYIHSSSSHAANNNINTIHNNRTTLEEQRNELQAVWYLWQDLGQLPQWPLQRDLESKWRNAAAEWWWTTDSNTNADNAAAAPTQTTTTNSYGKTVLQQQQGPKFVIRSGHSAADYIAWCYDKHVHTAVWAPWLPQAWLWSLLDATVTAPYLTLQHLLAAETLHPLLLQAAGLNNNNNNNANGNEPFSTPMQSSRTGNTNMTAGTAASNNSNNNKLSPIQQLWMLAGRVPGGQQQVATAIAQFARSQGLQRCMNANNSNAAAASGTALLTEASPGSPTPQQQSAAAAAASTNNNNSSNNNNNNNNNIVNNATSVIADLLHLQECLQQMIATLPGGHELIHLKSVWEEVVNVDMTPTIAESLAKFLDTVLRSNKKMDQYQAQAETAAAHAAAAAGRNHNLVAAAAAANNNQWLERIIHGLFVPLQAKDVFEAFYKRDLAKRLLWSRVVSMDVEKQVCSLLKAECGAGYTSKMEGMFQDVDWSRETMMLYKQSTGVGQTQLAGAVEMEVQVLTTGYWPVYPQYPNLNLPESLRIPQDHFSNHYKTKYQGRRMTWQYALGHCVVRASGFKRMYEFVVSLCQALVLIQFETDKTRWTLPALMQAVGLEDRDEMERILQSLSLGKEGTRILRKLDFDPEPNKKKKIRMKVDDKDMFEINRHFESNNRRIRIQNIMMKETKEEREKTVEAVSRDRLYLIDAVLVRILKARKTILHKTLIPQVLEQVKVPAQPADVKKRIESLIEREYMERDAKDRNRYNYLA